MTILDDVKKLPKKIGAGFEKVGSEIETIGRSAVNKIAGFGDTAYDKTKGFITDTMIPKLESIGGSGLNLAKGVKDKIVEGGKFLADEGIPFVKNAGKSALRAMIMVYWIIATLLIVILFTLLNKGYGLFIGKALPSTVVYAIMGLLLVVLGMVLMRAYKAVKKLSDLAN